MNVKTFYRIFTVSMLALVISMLGVQSASAITDKKWINPVNGGLWSGAANWEGGVAPINGDITYFNSSSSGSDLIINNDISPHLTLNGMVFTGSGNNGVILNGEGIRIHGNITDDNSSNVVSNDVHINIGADSTTKVIATNNATIEFYGDFYMGPYNLGLRAYDFSIIAIYGNVFGTGRVYVSKGYTFLEESAVVTRPVQVQEGGYLVGIGGITGSLTVNSDSSLTAYKKCMSTKNLIVDGLLQVYIEGATTCSEYGRINAHGTVDVSGGTLATKHALDFGGDYTPALGSKYILISNDGTDAVIGTFNNRPEGSTFKIGIYTFQITYRGGSGNDVVMTRL